MKKDILDKVVKTSPSCTLLLAYIARQLFKFHIHLLYGRVALQYVSQ